MIGKIKFFKREKKYGFIEVQGSEVDYFFHITNVSDDSVKCMQNEDVEFDATENKAKPGHFEAINVRHPEGYKERKIRLHGHPKTYLMQWGYIQLDDMVSDDGTVRPGVLHDLARMALPEDWALGHKEDTRCPYPILRGYVVHTFYKLYKDGGVLEVSHQGENWAAFNTGLVNELYDPIYALFEENDQPPRPWKFYSFCCANIGSSGQILVRNFNPLPDPARYFRKLQQVIFDPDITIAPRYDHIVYDSIERGRYPSEFLKKHLPPGLEWKDPQGLVVGERKAYLRQFREAIERSPRTDRDIRNRIDDAIELAVKRARWNFKTAIPMYFAHSGDISLLLPIALVNDEQVDLALVIVRTAAGGYSGETVYKLNWAYDHARLVCRPDSDWLRPRSEGDEEDEEEASENLETAEAELAAL